MNFDKPTNITYHNIYNSHVNDAQNFCFNGAARRRAFGGANRVDSRVPVILVPGTVYPHLEGERGGHYTKGGTPIKHPSSYSQNGWSNMTYICDTRRVIVGADWVPESWGSWGLSYFLLR